MYFEVKKAENCFSDSENYEYRLELDCKALIALLEGGQKNSTAKAPGEKRSKVEAPVLKSLKINEGLRRPTFVAVLDNGVQLKGLLEKNVIKVGYIPSFAGAQRKAFEEWLREID